MRYLGALVVFSVERRELRGSSCFFVVCFAGSVVRFQQGKSGGLTVQAPLGEALLPLLTALFLSAFFRHGKSPLSCFRLREPFDSSPRSLCRLARQLARNGTARFGADSLRA